MGRFARLVVCTLGATGLVMAAACTPPTTTPPANQAPNAVATADPTSGAAPLVVSFDGSTSTDPDGTIASHSWNFGDGDTDTGATVDHTYDTAGSYTAVLTVTDNRGRTDTAPVSIEVIVGNIPPTAVLGATPTTGTAPLAVAFSRPARPTPTAPSSRPSGSSATAARPPTPTPSHTYTAAGLFVASLTVTDDDGATSTDTVTITVDANQPPTAVGDRHADVRQGPARSSPSRARPRPTSTAPLLTFSWAFGDGGTSTQRRPEPHLHRTRRLHRRADRQRRQRQLRHRRRSSSPSTPTSPPTAVANATPSAGQAPLTVNFSSASSVDPDGTIVARSWDFGDGNSLDRGRTRPTPTAPSAPTPRR